MSAFYWVDVPHGTIDSHSHLLPFNFSHSARKSVIKLQLRTQKINQNFNLINKKGKPQTNACFVFIRSRRVSFPHLLMYASAPDGGRRALSAEGSFSGRSGTLPCWFFHHRQHQTNQTAREPAK